MNRLYLALGLAALAAVAAAQAPQQQAVLTDAEVRSVDRKMGRITLQHAPMPHLSMPAMTMAFQVQDPALLEKVKPGDKVKFDAEKRGVGYTITRMEPAP